MPASAVHLELHKTSDTVTGGWCPDCALPSVISARFALVDCHTLNVVHRFTMTVCTDCDRQQSSPPDRE